jgi:hypothetical protein
VSVREVGRPVPTFAHYRLSYSRTHHSTDDTLIEVKEADLRQASTVAAIGVLCRDGAASLAVTFSA